MRLLFKATMLPTSHDEHTLDLDLDESVNYNVEEFERWWESIGGVKGAPVLARIFDDGAEDDENRADDDGVVMLSRAYSKPHSVEAFRWMIRGLDWAEYDADNLKLAKAIHHVENVSDSFAGDESELSNYEATDDISDWSSDSVETELQELKDACDGRVEDYVDWEAVRKNLVEARDEDDCYSGKYVIDDNTYFVRLS